MGDAVEHLDHRTHAHLEAGLFEHLAHEARLERLPDLDRAARKTPLSGQRLVLPLDEQHLSVLHDHRTNADVGTIRILVVARVVHVAHSPITLITTRFFRWPSNSA